MDYYLPQPPFLIPVVGLLIAIVFGLTLQTQLETVNQEWRKNPQSDRAYNLEKTTLNIPYIGICLGTLIFLGGGLQIIGFGFIGSYGFSLLLTIGTGAFLWQQFGEMLLEIKEKGYKSLDLDS